MRVRKAVAKNPNTPIETLTELAKDKERFVREAVVRNPKTPIEIITNLAKDKNLKVRRATIEKLYLLPCE
ncbi:MAG: hypothetical protein LBC61_06120 [Candidatus Peribacteria bacterium]|nr:hypothetical protein [Candidatus Peribacteria bacterium]